MPWIHLHVANQGKVQACCVANIPFGNINEQNLEEIWQGAPIQKLRKKFLNGEKDKRCAACYKLEAAGGTSIRQETFEKFSHVKIKEEVPSLPVYFDIRFSNVCNFRCRTCWHGASSKWFSDAKSLGRNIGEKAIIQNVQDFESFIEKCGKALLQAEEIYFAGGEPLATEEHYLLLNWLIKNKATQMRLRYNTNFSMLEFRKYNVITMWKHFSEVEILASIDGVGALGEYIRKDMSWASILENRATINELDHIKFKISPTVSVFNIRHLPTLYQTCLELKMIEQDDMYINILERPTHLNIKILPPYYKELVQKEYAIFFERESLSENVKAMLQECLDYMWAENLTEKWWQKFQVETQLLDNLRKETMQNVLNF